MTDVTKKVKILVRATRQAADRHREDTAPKALEFTLGHCDLATELIRIIEKVDTTGNWQSELIVKDIESALAEAWLQGWPTDRDVA